MTEHLAVARLGNRGDGIVETKAGPIYVPYALPGETVAVEQWPGHADRRQLVAVEVPSRERIVPICPHFGVCGGCALQHWVPARYREWKRDLLSQSLAHVGISVEMDDLVDAHGEGRRRVVLHVRYGERGLIEVGFAASRTHRIISIDQCPILAPSLHGAIAAAWAIAEAVAPAGKPLDIQATATDQGLDVDVRGSGPLPAAQMTALANTAKRHRLSRLTRHGELVFQYSLPTLRIGRADLVLPPGAFLQATAAGEIALAELVATRCRAASRIADLFCGVGPFALRLAERAPVHAFDNDAAAIAALQRASAQTQGLKPVHAASRDLFRRPLAPNELNGFDAVVFDPPRQGAEMQSRALAASTVSTIVAVSCNPATFARDARILMDAGYRLVRVTPVDQFRYSPHLEVVGCFSRSGIR
jgi:23S rRNA (uracil1939-C5)-methyltransferase